MPAQQTRVGWSNLYWPLVWLREQETTWNQWTVLRRTVVMMAMQQHHHLCEAQGCCRLLMRLQVAPLRLLTQQLHHPKRRC